MPGVCEGTSSGQGGVRRNALFIFFLIVSDTKVFQVQLRHVKINLTVNDSRGDPMVLQVDILKDYTNV